MDDASHTPLDDLDEEALFRLLGDAWYAVLKTEPGGSYVLPSSTDVGKREFEAIGPVLREALRQPYYQGVLARVASTLAVEATWRMPATVVVALARRRGMISGKRENYPAPPPSAVMAK